MMKQQKRYNRGKKDTMKTEKIVMLTTSALVLGALTMTGVYVKNDQNKKQDGYKLDYESLEKNMEDEFKFPSISQNEKTQKENTNIAKNNETTNKDVVNGKTELEEGLAKLDIEDDLDYLPMQEAGSSNVVNETVSNKEEVKGGTTKEPIEDAGKDSKVQETSTKNIQTVEKQLHFQAENGMVLPISGNVLIPYSMDGTVYFATLDQYKYSPAMVIAAKENTTITASMPGKVSSVFYEDEIGNAIKLELGDGYEIIYGQLKDIAVKQGDYVENGTVLGTINVPTKYYMKEGANLYIKMMKDEEPVDPMHPTGEIIE